MKDSLTVLIPTWNRAEDLEQALQRMQAVGLGDLDYLIYDDASDDGDATERAAKVLSRAKVIRGQKRMGPAGGRNVLLQSCNTPYALLMDDDTWFTDADELGRIVSRDLYYHGIGKASAVCSQVFRSEDGETIFPLHMDSEQILNPLGGGCLVRVADVLRAGAFKSYWRYRHEETELGLRLWKHRMKVVYDRSLVVEHCHSAAARSTDEYVQNSARNVILMDGMNLPSPLGYSLGVLRACRLFLDSEYPRKAVMKGFFEGHRDLVRYRSDIAPMSYSRYRELLRFKKTLAAKWQE